MHAHMIQFLFFLTPLMVPNSLLYHIGHSLQAAHVRFQSENIDAWMMSNIFFCIPFMVLDNFFSHFLYRIHHYREICSKL